MANPKSGPGITIQMTSKQCIDLLEHLKDATFRAQVESDPNKALSPYGIEIASTLLGGVIKLPSVEKIQGILDCIGKKVSTAPLGALPYNIFGVFEIFIPPPPSSMEMSPGEFKLKGQTKGGKPIDEPSRKERPSRRPYRGSSE